jgi:hypothetical protein
VKQQRQIFRVFSSLVYGKFINFSITFATEKSIAPPPKVKSSVTQGNTNNQIVQNITVKSDNISAMGNKTHVHKTS